MLDLRRAGIAVVWCCAAVPAAAGTVDFAADIVPILNARCVACHLTGQEQGELALHRRVAYDQLVAVPSRQSPLNRVEPGSPERSYLYLKLTNAHMAAGGSGEPMPMGGGILPAAELALVRQWIAEGAARVNETGGDGGE